MKKKKRRREKKSEEKERFADWGEGIKMCLSALFVSAQTPQPPPSPRMPAEQCPALFLKISTQMTGMSFLSFTSFFKKY